MFSHVCVTLSRCVPPHRHTLSLLRRSPTTPSLCSAAAAATAVSALLLSCAHATSSSSPPSHSSSSSGQHSQQQQQQQHRASSHSHGSHAATSHAGLTQRSAGAIAPSFTAAAPTSLSAREGSGGGSSVATGTGHSCNTAAASSSSSHAQHPLRNSAKGNNNNNSSSSHTHGSSESQRTTEKRRTGAAAAASLPTALKLKRKSKKCKARRAREKSSTRLAGTSGSGATSRARPTAVGKVASTSTSSNNSNSHANAATAAASTLSTTATPPSPRRRNAIIITSSSSSSASSSTPTSALHHNNSSISGSITSSDSRSSSSSSNAESARSVEPGNIKAAAAAAAATASGQLSKSIDSVQHARRVRATRAAPSITDGAHSKHRVATKSRENSNPNRSATHSSSSTSDGNNNNNDSAMNDNVTRYRTRRSSSSSASLSSSSSRARAHHPHVRRIASHLRRSAHNSSSAVGSKDDSHNHGTHASHPARIPCTSTSAVKQKARTAAHVHKKLRVCVLGSRYEKGTKMAEFDDFWCSPQYYIPRCNRSRYSFADVNMNKTHAYRTIRELVACNKYDVFFNLCDGAKDEGRAGVDVVHALEEMNAAFTGGDSRGFEPNKITMKLMVSSCGVRVPNFVRLQNDQALAKKCRHLRFPVIVKHESGYASEGIHRDSRCHTLDELAVVVRRFMKEYNHALVEEFIRGREGTVLTCADAQSPHGVKVFPPLMFHFLRSPDDFQYFERKWTVEFDARAASALPASDAAYAGIVDMARHAHRYILNSVGYGRVDFRIEDGTEVPYFLEINPNCGMWYSPKDGGDYADAMVHHDPHWSHERFFRNAVARALREQAIRRPWHILSHDTHGAFTTRASRSVPAGRLLFDDAHHPIPVITRAVYKLGPTTTTSQSQSQSTSSLTALNRDDEEVKVGCVVERGDGKPQSVALRHSCEPNMQLVHGRTLTLEARRAISAGEELTIDYATLRDEAMPTFACQCGTETCRGVIFATPALPRTVELKSMRRWTREKKSAWLREKAVRLARRRLSNSNSSSSSSSNSNTHTSGGSNNSHTNSSSNSGNHSAVASGSGGVSVLSKSAGAEGGHANAHTSGRVGAVTTSSAVSTSAGGSGGVVGAHGSGGASASTGHGGGGRAAPSTHSSSRPRTSN